MSGGVLAWLSAWGKVQICMAQLMPLPLTVSCSSKSTLVFPFWYRLTRVVLDKRPLNGCIYYLCMYRCNSSLHLRTYSMQFTLIQWYKGDCCKHRNVYSLVDGVVRLHGVDRMSFSPVDDLLGVVEKKSAEQDQTSIQCHWIEPGSNGCCCRQEPRACRTTQCFINQLNHTG